ncbi:MAG: hypothetical protein IJF09_01075 [Ruminiclostridium sp.]|nr:hypothetical protein [Ruminiclostridium sp.]
MQWNKVNISKDELKRKQDKYIKEAIEISKKSRVTEEISVPVIISIPEGQAPEEDIAETTEVVHMPEFEENNSVENVISDLPSDIEITTEETDTAQSIADIDKSDEIDTTASEEISDDTEKEDTPQALFDNVFITEEEAERKLSEAEISLSKISEEAPDFEGYIKNHNQKSESNKSDSFADE